MNTEIAESSPQTFVVWSDEIEGRLDFDFYKPEYFELEKRVRGQGARELGEYILSLAGGATPEKANNSLYSDSRNGIPFIRVQNLSPEGISLSDCKFITPEVHNGPLKRSQIRPSDLLIKITGVGRMAISSVAPAGFEGNVNQHIVVIKTKDSRTSEVIASYLNSDIGEKLASRRSTGGTRPALDYEALKKIPIVFEPKILDIMHAVYKEKRNREARAQSLLDSIDSYVLGELGIRLTETGNQMTFSIWSDELEGALNPERYVGKAFFHSRKSVSDYCTVINDVVSPARFPERAFDWIRIDNILNGGKLTDDSIVTLEGSQINGTVQYAKSGDILLARLGPSLANRKILVCPKTENKTVVSNEFIVCRPKTGVTSNALLAVFITEPYLKYILSKGRGATPSRLRIGRDDFGNLLFPDVETDVLNKVGAKVFEKTLEANRLRKEAQKMLDIAKKKVERMILGAG